ncbi:MAG: hypothetical protein IJV40_04260 [Oscillospiraceae bacterium]|nr:hypothetical protein [Oscillospiraceae bacterium]
MKSNRTTALLMLLVFLLVVAVVIIFLTGLDRPVNSGNPYENVTATAAPSVEVETPEPTPTPEPSTAPTAAPSAPVYYPPSTAMPSQTQRPITTASPSGTGNGGGTGVAVPTPTPSAAPIPGADPNMLPAEELIPVVPGANTGSSTDGSGDSAPAVIPTGTSLGSGTFRSDSGTSINIHADWNALVAGANTVDVTITAYVDSYSLITTASPETLNISIDGQYISLASPAIDIPTTTNQVTTLINNRTFTIPLTGGETRSIPVEVVWNYRGTYGGTYLDTIECGGNITLSR